MPELLKHLTLRLDGEGFFFLERMRATERGRIMYDSCQLGREQLFQAFSVPVKCQALMQDTLAAFSALLERKKEMRSA